MCFLDNDRAVDNGVAGSEQPVPILAAKPVNDERCEVVYQKELIERHSLRLSVGPRRVRQ